MAGLIGILYDCQLKKIVPKLEPEHEDGYVAELVKIMQNCSFIDDYTHYVL